MRPPLYHGAVGPPLYALTAYDADETVLRKPGRTAGSAPVRHGDRAVTGACTKEPCEAGVEPRRPVEPPAPSAGPASDPRPSSGVPQQSRRAPGPPPGELEDLEDPESLSARSDGLWALCADAQDLFRDPPPAARALFALRDCTPEGPLRAALARFEPCRASETPPSHEDHDAAPSAPLGLLVLETLDASGKPLSEWQLTDARLVAARRSAHHPGSYDLTVEAIAHEDQPDHPHHPPDSPGHRLRGTNHRPLGHCRDLTCVREAPPDSEEPPIRLIGCSPSGLLRTALAIGDEELGHAKILRLDEDGQMLQYVAEGEVTAWIPSSLGRGLVDLTLEPWSQRPPSAARDVWTRWSSGRPGRPNLWADCGVEGRRFWLRTAQDHAIRRCSAPHAVAGRTYHLDGRHITDELGFYCALGEAVHGPGGYFGQDADTLIDCLCGNRGTLPDPPPTLVWHDASTARACLGVTPQTARPPTFEELVTLLTRCGVETVLA